MNLERQPYPEFAFVYAAPLESSMLKSLLLFFDGIAIVAAEQRIAHAIQHEPWFFLPLLQSELSKFWTPAEFFDTEYRKLHEAELRQFLATDVYQDRQPSLEVGNYLFASQLPFPLADTDNLAAQDDANRVTDDLLGLKRILGGAVEPGGLLEELQQRGLVEIRQSGAFMNASPLALGGQLNPIPGVTPGPAGIPMPSGPSVGEAPTVLAIDRVLRQVNDALVSQFARVQGGRRFGVVLQPMNANEDSLTRLIDFWRGSRREMMVGEVVLRDLDVVGPALDLVSIDDLLHFREQHGAEHREYMRELQRYVLDISRLTPEELENELHWRRQELSDRASALAGVGRAKWKSAARFLLGITGAALTLSTGNVPGATVSGGQALLGLGGTRESAGALTYLCHIAKLY